MVRLFKFSANAVLGLLAGLGLARGLGASDFTTLLYVLTGLTFGCLAGLAAIF